MYALSSFQRTDAHRVGYPLPVAFPSLLGPSLGEPSKVTTEEVLCQYPAKSFYLASRSGTKKLLRNFFGATIRPPGPGLAYRTSPTLYHTIHALGVGFPRPLRRLDVSGYWLSRLNRPSEPRARYLTRVTAAYIAAVSVTSSDDHTVPTQLGQVRAIRQPARYAARADLCAAQSPVARSRRPS